MEHEVKEWITYGYKGGGGKEATLVDSTCVKFLQHESLPRQQTRVDTKDHQGHDYGVSAMHGC